MMQKHNRHKVFAKTITFLSLALCYIFLVNSANAAALKDEFFSIPTADGKARLEGSITLPSSTREAKLTPVIFVGGTHATSDGEIFVLPNDPNWKAKLWLKELGDKVASRGFAVVRFNNRGIHSTIDCNRIAGKVLTAKEYASDLDCINGEFALTTTFQTQEADITSVSEMVAKDNRLDPGRVIFVVHSEGAYHVTKLLSSGAIRPAGILFMSSPVCSPAELTHWQEVDRQVEWVRQSIERNAGYFSNDEINKRYVKELKGNLLNPAPLMSSDGRWTTANLEKLKSQLEEAAAKDLQNIHSFPADAATTGPIADATSNATIILASNSHWQSMLSDAFQPIEGLKKFSGDVSFAYGENDITVPIDLQVSLIKDANLHTKSLKLFRLRDAEHTFRREDGQLNEDAIAALVNEVVRLSRVSRILKSR